MKFGEERTIRRQSIYKGAIIDVVVDDVQLPDGKEAKREIVQHPGAVGIIALTDEGKIVLVEQFRKPLERAIVEIPAGKIDAGESLETCALRELEEETGYRAHSLKKVQSFATSPGFADEVMHLYFAEQLEKVDDPLQGDEDEFIRLHEWTIDEALKRMDEGKVYDAKTAFALLYVKQFVLYN